MDHPSNPDWYEALQGNHLRKRTFTDQLAARIKARAVSTTTSRISVTRKFAFLGASMLAVMAIIVFINGNYLNNSNMTSERNSNSTNQSVSGTSSQLSNDEAIGQSDDQIQFSKTLTDSEWQQLLNRDDHQGSGLEMRYKESVGEDKMLVFSSNGFADGNLYLRVDEYDWTTQVRGLYNNTQYQWVNNGLTSSSMSEESYKNTIITVPTRRNDISIFMGAIIDPHVSEIRVSDNYNGFKLAEIVRDDEGNAYWFAVLTWDSIKKWEYKVETLDTESKLLSEETFRM